MTTEDPSKVTAIIETTTARKRKEEGSRLHVHLSFPLRPNGNLALMLQDQLGNPIEVTFAQPMQLRLADKPPLPTETISTTVDGEPAKINRTRRSRVDNATKTRLEAMQTAAQSPHVFDHNPEDGNCRRCGHAPDMPVHLDVPSWTQRYEHWLNDGQDRGESMAASIAADDVSNGLALPMTDEETALSDRLQGDESLSEAAAKLIDQARDDDEASRVPPANDAEAQEQTNAEAALAARAR